MNRDRTGSLNRAALTALLLLAAACGDDNLIQPPASALYTTPTGLVTANPPQIFIGAGDISSCSNNGDESTARILDTIPGTVYNLGDDAYNNGTTSEFNNCYHPTWGRHKARTMPSAGNHEYNTSGASGYYQYFGAAAGDPSKGYYSYDLGSWHIIVLNSNITKSAGSAQDNWLKGVLAAHPNQCTAAYFHHPLYSSTGGTGSGGTTYSSMRALYNTLYAGGIDVVLAGHRHFYERLALMKPDGTRDNTNGFRTFIVGSGGIGGGGVTNKFPLSETANGDTRGVLKMYLYEDSYAWRFIPEAGKTYTDTGSTACNGMPTGGGSGVSGSNSALAASPASIAASSGGTTSIITVTARDGNGNPVSGASVVISATGTGNTIGQPSSTTNSSGVATGTLSSTVAGAKTVSATANGVAITQTAAVTVTPAAPAALAFLVQPSTVAVGATITPAVQVEIRDQFGNRVTGATNGVTLAIGNNPGSGTLGGTLTVNAANGVATFSNLTIDKVGTGYTLTAAATGLSGATSSAFNVTGVPPSASLSGVAASPTSITAGGAGATITVTARTAGGTPLSGATVVLAATGSGNTITQPAATTDANGEATGTLTSTGAGSKTVSATIDGVPITQTAAVTVTAAGPSATTSTVAASPATITVGTGTSTITVTVKDAFGNPVNNVPVALAATGSGNTLTQPAGNTNASGVATGTLQSTVAEPKTVSAIADGSTSITQTATVTVTDQPPAGITHTLLTAGNNTANQSVYTTASVSPAPNALITLAVLGHRSSGANPAPVITGAGLTWVQVASVTFDTLGAPLKRMTLYRAMSAAPGSGPITITFSGSVSNAQWIVSQWVGAETSGTDGSGAIGQVVTNAANAVSGMSVTLGAFSNAANVSFGVFGVNSSTAAITPGSGFTEIAEMSSAESPLASLETEWAVNHPTINALWTNLRGAVFGVEIKAKTGP